MKRQKTRCKIHDAGSRIKNAKHMTSSIWYLASASADKSGIWHRSSKGFTLIEIVMIIVIASIAIPTLLVLLGEQVKHGADAEIRVTAANIAQKLTEEIKTKRWDENAPIPPGAYTATLGPEGIETRTACNETPSTYDDVDDYNGYSETCTWGGISFRTDVAVCYVDPADLTTCVGLSDYKRITVTISNPNISSVEIATLVSNL